MTRIMTVPLLPDEDYPQQEEKGLGALRTPNGNLPLKEVGVRARIAGLHALTTLEQTFKNTLALPLEATYIFPLPSQAAVTQFVMQVGERRVEGVLEERQKAREDYEKAIQEGHRAAITEEERQNVFTLRVGNLMPGEEAKVTFSMVCPLDVDAGEVTYRFPLVVAPRYIPGTPLDDESVGDGVVPDTDQVPDASRITPPVLLPGFPNPVRLSIEVEVDNAGLPIRDLRSSLHAVYTEEDNGVTRIVLQPGDRLNRDFILRYRILHEDFAAGALACLDAEAQAGTFHLVITAPPIDQHTRPPRDIVFVIDRSGSMSGWKIDAARRITGRLLDSLQARDRFGLIAFDTSVETFGDRPAVTIHEASNQNRFRALEWLARIDARDGTEILPALNQALKVGWRPEGEASRAIVLVTDGQVGNEDAIVRKMKQAGIAMFVVGVDVAVNEALTRRLAESTGGTYEMIESEERLDETLARLIERLGAPVLRDVRVIARGAKLLQESVVPREQVAIYPGSTAVLMGRFSEAQGGWSLQVSGVLPDGAPWQKEAEPKISDHPAVRPAWARALIRKLEDEYVTAPFPELEQRILQTSLENRVLCRFTAYIAIDRSEVVNAGGEVRRIVQPVETPYGWEMFGPQHLESLGFDRAVYSQSIAEPAALANLHDKILSHTKSPLQERSVEDYLRRLQESPGLTSQEIFELLSELAQALQDWINDLQRKRSATKMVQRLQALYHAIQQFDWVREDERELQQLLLECRETLEALQSSGLLSRRRTRWW